MDYHSSANQSILGRLVEHEVLCNISCLVSEIAQLVHSGGQSDGINEELIHEAYEVLGPMQYQERAEEEGYKLVERDDEYSWYDENDPDFKGRVPFVEPPPGMEVMSFEGLWGVLDEGLEEEVCVEDFECSTREEAITKAWEDVWPNDWFDDEEDAWGDCCNENSLYPDPVEVYEHWIVNSWFADKLRDKGERVVCFGSNDVWCRTCTGQAILLDHVIGEIADDMEILEGQKYDWSKNECVHM